MPSDNIFDAQVDPPAACSCAEHTTKAYICVHGCHLAEYLDSGVYIVSGAGCSEHEGFRHVVPGCSIHDNRPPLGTLIVPMPHLGRPAQRRMIIAGVMAANSARKPCATVQTTSATPRPPGSAQSTPSLALTSDLRSSDSALLVATTPPGSLETTSAAPSSPGSTKSIPSLAPTSDLRSSDSALSVAATPPGCPESTCATSSSTGSTHKSAPFTVLELAGWSKSQWDDYIASCWPALDPSTVPMYENEFDLPTLKIPEIYGTPPPTPTEGEYDWCTESKAN